MTESEKNWNHYFDASLIYFFDDLMHSKKFLYGTYNNIKQFDGNIDSFYLIYTLALMDSKIKELLENEASNEKVNDINKSSLENQKERIYILFFTRYEGGKDQKPRLNRIQNFIHSNYYD